MAPPDVFAMPNLTQNARQPVPVGARQLLNRNGFWLFHLGNCAYLLSFLLLFLLPCSAQVDRYVQDASRPLPFWNRGHTFKAPPFVSLRYALDSAPEGKTFLAAGLPPGLRIDPATGVVEGTALREGSFPAIIAVKEGASLPRYYRFQFVIEAPKDPIVPGAPPFPEGPIVKLAKGDSLLKRPSLYHGEFHQMTVTSSLPAGLNWDMAAGRFTGFPNKPGVYPLEVDLSVGDKILSTVVIVETLTTSNDLIFEPVEERALCMGENRVLLLDNLSGRSHLRVGELDFSQKSIVFSEGSLPDTELNFKLVYALGLFIIVTDDLKIYTSDTGQNWRARAPIVHLLSKNESIQRLYASPRILALTGSQGSRAFTTDLKTWTPPNWGLKETLDAFTDTGDTFLAYTSSFMKKTVYKSRDGVDWETAGESSHFVYDVAKVDSGYAAIGAVERGHWLRLLSSDDGIQWSLNPALSEPITTESQLWHDGASILLSTHEKVYRSVDGTNFQLLAQGRSVGSRMASFNGVYALATEASLSFIPLRKQAKIIQATPGAFIDQLSVSPFEFFSYKINTHPKGAAVEAFGLPNTLSFDETTSQILGFLEEPGFVDITLTASGPSGRGSPAVLRIHVKDSDGPPRPLLQGLSYKTKGFGFREQSARLPVIFSAGAPVTIKLSINQPHESLAIQAVGLPEGLSASADEISGAVAEPGRHEFAVQMSGEGGDITERIVLWVYNPDFSIELPDPPHLAGFPLAQPIEWKFQATGAEAVRFYARGIPPGLALDPETGTIFGIPGLAGDYRITVTAEEATGQFAKPLTISVEVGQREEFKPDRIPSSLNSIVIIAEETGSHQFSLQSGELLELLDLPKGLRFTPPDKLIAGPSLLPGIYEIPFRLSNQIGTLTGNVALAKHRPFTAQVAIHPNPHPDPRAGQPFRMTFFDEGKVREYAAVGLPPGLTIDNQTGEISGVATETGVFNYLLYYLEGERSGIFTGRLEVVPPAHNLTPTGYSYRFTGVEGERDIWEMQLPPPLQNDSLSATRLPPGIDWNDDNRKSFEGTPSRDGARKSELTGRSTGESIEISWHIYQRPRWGNWWVDSGAFPARGLFQPAAEVLFGKFDGFLSEAPIVTRSALEQSWRPLLLHPLPGRENFVGAQVDVLADGTYFLAQFSEFGYGKHNDAIRLNLTPTFSSVTDVVAGDGSIALIQEEFLSTFEPGRGIVSTTWTDNRAPLNRVAFGNNLFVAAGEAGSIAVLTSDGLELKTESPLMAYYDKIDPRFGQAALLDVIYAGEDFFACGDHGVIVRSHDGMEWQIERPPRFLGESLYQLVANDEWLVALGNFQDFVRPLRAEGSWMRVDRVPDPDGHTDDLKWPNGIVRGLQDGLLIPSRPRGDAVLLTPDRIYLTAGEPSEIPILFYGSAEEIEVSGVPPGLTYTPEELLISGSPAIVGNWDILVEWVSNGRRMGHTISCDLALPEVRDRQRVYQVTAGHPFQAVFAIALNQRIMAIDGDFPKEWKADIIGNQLVVSGYYPDPGTSELTVTLASTYGDTPVTLFFDVAPLSPVFLEQPRSQLLSYDEPTTLSVVVSAARPLSYYWYYNDQRLIDTGEISGSTTDGLTINSPELSGNYHVIVENGDGVSRSLTATLRPPPHPNALNYDSWLQAIAPPGNDGFTDDANGNGIANGIEFALLGRAPAAQLAERLLSLRQRPDGRTVLSFTKAADTSGVHLSLDFSINLSDWSAVPENDLVFRREGTSVNVEFALQRQGTVFYRLRAALQ